MLRAVAAVVTALLLFSAAPIRARSFRDVHYYTGTVGCNQKTSALWEIQPRLLCERTVKSRIIHILAAGDFSDH